MSSTNAASTPDTTSAAEVLEDDTTDMHIEIPFVPAAQRQITAVVEDKDKDKDTVVVGKPKAKKRKRTKTLVVNEDKPVKDASEGIPSVILVESESEVKDESFDFSRIFWMIIQTWRIGVR
jgi:hypothetical protein